MGKRISFDVPRCIKCKMHKTLCICSHMPQIKTKTKTVLVIHTREFVKISATGPLALECLPNSELLIHGRRELPVDLSVYQNKQSRPLFLYPRGGARELSKEMVEEDSRPITLIVPDGSWGQAAKMGRKLPGIESCTYVTLPKGQKTNWGLRKEPHEDGLSTFEAIARALGILEGEDVQFELEEFFSTMVQTVKTLRGTG